MEGPMCRKEEQLTISELAEILDKNERTIKNALSRITDKLEIGSNIYELFKNLTWDMSASKNSSIIDIKESIEIVCYSNLHVNLQ